MDELDKLRQQLKEIDSLIEEQTNTIDSHRHTIELLIEDNNTLRTRRVEVMGKLISLLSSEVDNATRTVQPSEKTS